MSPRSGMTSGPFQHGVPVPRGAPRTGARRRARVAAPGRALVALLLLGGQAPATAAAAGVTLPAGFTGDVYVTGQGFGRGEAGAGVPVATTLGLDAAGWLYLAKSGSRYGGVSETEASLLSQVYRIPPGGARLTPATEGQFLHGPLLRNPEVGAVGSGGEVLVTTYDPERGVGVVYRLRDGRAMLLAGGTPLAGGSPLFRQPEGIAVDAAGHVYVEDRGRDRVTRLDRSGAVLEPAWLGLRVPRARMLAIDTAGHLWVAGDGTAAAPWQEGIGQIWRIGPDGTARLVVEGPHAAAIAAGPEGALFVADRHAGQLYVLTSDGRRLEFAAFQDGSLPRGLAFAPVTPETRQAGIAGALFVVTFTMRTWFLNEVIRISGPFDDLARR